MNPVVRNSAKENAHYCCAELVHRANQWAAQFCPVTCHSTSVSEGGAGTEGALGTRWRSAADSIWFVRCTNSRDVVVPPPHTHLVLLLSASVSLFFSSGVEEGSCSNLQVTWYPNVTIYSHWSVSTALRRLDSARWQLFHLPASMLFLISGVSIKWSPS